MIMVSVSGATTLKLRDLSFSWSGQAKHIFGRLSIGFEKGSVTTLLGPNGVGKTTLLNVIACRLPPSSGSIEVDGRPANIRDFNYMPQDSARLLFSHLSIAQNLGLHRGSKLKHQKDYTNLVNLLFSDSRLLHSYPGQCSGGQRQRVVLGRAILDIPHFPVTLLDEPLAQISQDIKTRIYSLLRETVRESNKAVLVVTHDIAEALLLGDQAVIISSAIPRVFDVSDIVDTQSLLRASALREAVQQAIFFANETETE